MSFDLYRVELTHESLSCISGAQIPKQGSDSLFGAVCGVAQEFTQGVRVLASQAVHNRPILQQRPTAFL